MHYYSFLGFAGGSGGKESACNAGDPGSILGSGRSPWEGTGNLLQYSCLENAMDRGTWQAIVHGVAKNWTWLSDSHTHTHTQFIHFSGTTLPSCAVPHSSPPALTASCMSLGMGVLIYSRGGLPCSSWSFRSCTTREPKKRQCRLRGPPIYQWYEGGLALLQFLLLPCSIQASAAGQSYTHLPLLGCPWRGSHGSP